MRTINCIVRYTRTDFETAIRDIDRRKHISINAYTGACTLKQAAHAHLASNDRGEVITGVRIMRICGRTSQ